MDWSKIEGYREDMTAEEKLALLEKQKPKEETPPEPPAEPPKEPPKPAPASKTVDKIQFDKVASELAAAKKALRAKQTDDEAKEAERLEQEDAMKTELESLRREKALSEHKASYLALGLDEKLASESAIALVDGDMELVFANLKKHSVSMEQTLRAKILKDTPVPPAGSNGGEVPKTREEEIHQRLYGTKGE